MASNSRGQPLAWQTKVVHQNLGALKAGSKPFLVSGGDNDAVSSKPITGRDMVDATILQNDSSIPRRVALIVKDLITHRNR